MAIRLQALFAFRAPYAGPLCLDGWTRLVLFASTCATPLSTALQTGLRYRVNATWTLHSHCGWFLLEKASTPLVWSS